MIKKIILIGIVFFNLTLFAQEKKGREKVRAYKIAYLTEKLDLTSEEAEKFWPVYNTYSKERRMLFKTEKGKIKSSIQDKGGIDNLSDKESEAILTKMSQLKETQHKKKIKFIETIKSFLPSKKVLKFELAESEFNKKLVHRLRDQKKHQ